MPQNHPSPDPSGLAMLTKRERECLELVVQRKGSKEIATVLDISPHTVDARIKSAMRKLNVTSRDVAALIFIESERLGHGVTVTSDHTNLASQSPDLARTNPSAEKGTSAREGNGLVASERTMASSSGLSDSGGGKSWLRELQPFAAFLGGKNNRSIGQIALDIFVTAAALLLGAGVFFNAFIGLSEMFKTP